METLDREGRVYVGNMSKTLNVTEETIRRDLEKLEKEGLVHRNHGGAILSDTGDDFSFAKQSTINRELKSAIGKKAAALIAGGGTVMMDSSTTRLSMLRHLRDTENLTIITNSIRLAHDFTGATFKIISTGGNLRAKSFALTGNITCSTIEKYFVDYAVLSCKGIDRENGIMESNEDESVVKQCMIKQAKKTIMLVDSTKFDKTAFTKTCDFSAVAILVTDKMPDRDWREFLHANQVQLITGEDTLI